MNSRGYYGIGIENVKRECNIGTLWRSAYSFGASFIFTIGRRYKPQSSDTTKTWKHIPCYEYLTTDDLPVPMECLIIGIEIGEGYHNIINYVHQERCIYILGAEDSGLSSKTRSKCHDIVYIPSGICLNVSVAGSIVMYDRVAKYSRKHSDWNKLLQTIEEGTISTGIKDLAHEHDHYLYGTPREYLVDYGKVANTEDMKQKARKLTRQGKIIEATRLFNEAWDIEHCGR